MADDLRWLVQRGRRWALSPGKRWLRRAQAACCCTRLYTRWCACPRAGCGQIRPALWIPAGMTCNSGGTPVPIDPLAQGLVLWFQGWCYVRDPDVPPSPVTDIPADETIAAPQQEIKCGPAYTTCESAACAPDPQDCGGDCDDVCFRLITPDGGPNGNPTTNVVCCCGERSADGNHARWNWEYHREYTVREAIIGPSIPTVCDSANGWQPCAETLTHHITEDTFGDPIYHPDQCDVQKSVLQREGHSDTGLPDGCFGQFRQFPDVIDVRWLQCGLAGWGNWEYETTSDTYCSVNPSCLVWAVRQAWRVQSTCNYAKIEEWYEVDGRECVTVGCGCLRTYRMYDVREWRIFPSSDPTNTCCGCATGILGGTCQQCTPLRVVQPSPTEGTNLVLPDGRLLPMSPAMQDGLNWARLHAGRPLSSLAGLASRPRVDQLPVPRTARQRLGFNDVRTLIR